MLVKWLTEQFGAAINIYHERPFTLLKDGNVYSGSIDLVWQTSDGDILIDFKTCPLGQKYILDSDSDHYAGWYAGQLDAYTDALEEAGEKVLKRFIYYPVSGMMCEIGRALKAPEMTMYANVYCFDASDSFDINKMIENAAKVFAEIDPDDEEIQRTTMYIKGGSTQGIETILLKTGLFTINLPYLASGTDVALAFTLMREARKLRSELVIYDGDDKTSEYIKAQMPDASPQEWTHKAFEDFIDIQWNYGDYENFSRATVSSPMGKNSLPAYWETTRALRVYARKLFSIMRRKQR